VLDGTNGNLNLKVTIKYTIPVDKLKISNINRQLLPIYCELILNEECLDPCALSSGVTKSVLTINHHHQKEKRSLLGERVTAHLVCMRTARATFYQSAFITDRPY